MGWLFSLFIAATFFGVGVTAVDLLGLMGDQDSSDSDSSGDDAGGQADSDGDGGADDLDYDGDADSDGGDDDTDSDGDDHTSVAGHDQRHKSNPVLKILSALRNLVYFSLGFGPTGWFAMGTGESVTASLLWSGGVGVVVLVGARLLRRVLRSELNSEIQDTDLVTERGEVIVTINPSQLGRVRINIGGTYVDRYARSKSDKAIGLGTSVRVVDVAEDCVIIESEED